MDLISVIVPIYNVEQYLIRCVESIQRQTYTALEIILVDDGSPDDCGKICDELAANDERIKVLHKINEGQGISRNEGLKLASGKYVTFVDSDDYIDDTHIENLYTALIADNADTSMGSLSYKRGESDAVRQMLHIDARVYEQEEVADCILLQLIGPDVECKQDVCIEGSACINLYSKDIIDRNDITFPCEKQAVSEDLFFNIQYFNCARKVVITEEYGYYYFENIGSETRKYNSEYYTRTFNFYTKMCELDINRLAVQDGVSLRIDRTFILKLRFLIRLIVMSDLSIEEKKAEIKRVLDNPTTQNVLDSYPTHKLVFAKRLLTYFMRKGNVTAVYYLTKYRQLAKNNRMLKKALKLMGIGKNQE